jgi:hypothetical protein
MRSAVRRLEATIKAGLLGVFDRASPCEMLEHSSGGKPLNCRAQEPFLYDPVFRLFQRPYAYKLWMYYGLRPQYGMRDWHRSRLNKIRGTLRVIQNTPD